MGWKLTAWRADERVGKKPEGEWYPLPDRLLDALREVASFTGRDHTKPWMMGVLLDGAYAYATNNYVAVEAEIGSAIPRVTLPAWVVAALTKRAVPPREILVAPGSVALAWEDGTWLSSASAGEMPDAVPNLFENWQEPQWQVPPDWKKAFFDMARLSDENIVIGPDHIKGGMGQMRSEAEASTPVSDETVWTAKLMVPVIKVAEKIDFSRWPGPAPFTFPNGRGIVMGRV